MKKEIDKMGYNRSKNPTFLFRLALSILLLSSTSLLAEVNILNVSFDPTRELYEELNRKFILFWKITTNANIKIQQSHGGSGKQARAVIDGLEADVVTLALAYDIDNIADRSSLVEKNWESQFPNHSIPYYSTIVLLVRKGNPKKIKDWDDLIFPGVGLVTPNPKVSGGARWNYLAAWGFAKRKYKTEDKAKDFIKKIYQHTSVLDTGARGSTTTFVKRGIGDVLITWENEARLALNESKKNGSGDFEIIYPSESIKAETPVAIVSGVAKRKGTQATARAYLQFIYSVDGQETVAKHFFRPIDQKVFKSNLVKFPSIKLFDIREIEGSWKDAHKKHFSDGGIFDAIYANAGK